MIMTGFKWCAFAFKSLIWSFVNLICVMNSNNNPDNKEIRVAQNSQISNLFTGLRGVAAVMLITGIVLVIIFSFLEVSPLVEWGVLLLFGVASGGYLMGR